MLSLLDGPALTSVHGRFQVHLTSEWGGAAIQPPLQVFSAFCPWRRLASSGLLSLRYDSATLSFSSPAGTSNVE